MGQGRPKKPLDLLDDERLALVRLTRRSTVSRALALRAQVILDCADGRTNADVAKRQRVHADTVCKWRERFRVHRLEGLYDEPRPGAPRKATDEKVEEVVVKTLESTPRGQTHWSRRLMAKEVGLSADTIGRIWSAFGLKPHLQETFKLSPDPLFIEKVRDVVGLYMSPPDNAIILCVDEKSQIQALDRTQPLLPLRPGQAERRTHDYKRNGTTTLFAALNVATGQVTSRFFSQHRHQEFLKFLADIDRAAPHDMDVHIVMDNYGTHKTPRVKAWFAKRPRFHVHFTPTYSSWLNLVERLFAELTERAIRRGAFTCVAELERAIREYLDARNESPKPFTWKATADEILDRVARFCGRISRSAH